MTTATEIKFTASRSAGEVSALLERGKDARWLMVLAHGAGAGMRHPFMEKAAEKLGAHGVATLRYQFPYMERRAKGPDPQPILLATVRAAVTTAREAAGDLPLLAGGKSMGGRMTSLASAEEPLEGVRGLVFFGFPLHPPGAPGVERADHLDRVRSPLLFLQGTRDTFADLDLLRPVIARLGERATLHAVDGGDHSFAMRKSSGRTNDQVLDELVQRVADWAGKLRATGG